MSEDRDDWTELVADALIMEIFADMTGREDADPGTASLTEEGKT